MTEIDFCEEGSVGFGQKVTMRSVDGGITEMNHNLRVAAN
jgi:hypothetical protein